jgi:hypothetical protein
MTDPCQYAKDIGMPEYRCAVKCQYGLEDTSRLKRIADAILALKLHPTTPEEYDAGYIAARNDAFAIVQEIIDNAE